MQSDPGKRPGFVCGRRTPSGEVNVVSSHETNSRPEHRTSIEVICHRRVATKASRLGQRRSKGHGSFTIAMKRDVGSSPQVAATPPCNRRKSRKRLEGEIRLDRELAHAGPRLANKKAKFPDTPSFVAGMVRATAGFKCANCKSAERFHRADRPSPRRSGPRIL